jgi:NAD(P)-dependent dehydrogenase (short-subunit alcohol dehydrogenase family)
VKDFDGRVAAITGAASGIGLALARRAADRGMKLALADIDQSGLDEATANLLAAGADAIAVVTDVSDAASVDAFRDATLSAYGAVHLVCNNAGVGGGGRTWETSLEVWRWVLDVDLWSVIHGIRAFVPTLLEQGEGHVVNTASLAGLAAIPGLAPYTVAKHAVVGLTELLAVELAETPVGVSVLCPAFVRTRIHEAERHAPAEVLALRGGIATEQLMERREMLTQLVEQGIDPDEVARRVFAGVEEDRLHILTHAMSLPAVRGRVDRLLADADAFAELPPEPADPSGTADDAPEG